MMLNGINIAAFRLSGVLVPDGINDECLFCDKLMMLNNMQAGGHDWSSVALRAPFNHYDLNDPAMYRTALSPGTTRDDRLSYQREWGWTEVAAYCPETTKWLADHEDLGQFLGLSKFMRVSGSGKINFHADNVPGKEFRIAVGLEGVENETFLINTGYGIEKIIMKPREVWFIDIAMSHAVFNKSDKPRYRLGAQFYGPPTDRLLEYFYQTDTIVYAADYEYEPDFVNL